MRRIVSLLNRLLLATPVLGRMLREVEEERHGAIWGLVLTIIGGVGVAALTFGLPGLVIAMLVMTGLVGLLVVNVAGG